MGVNVTKSGSPNSKKKNVLETKDSTFSANKCSSNNSGYIISRVNSTTFSCEQQGSSDDRHRDINGMSPPRSNAGPYGASPQKTSAAGSHGYSSDGSCTRNSSHRRRVETQSFELPCNEDEDLDDFVLASTCTLSCSPTFCAPVREANDNHRRGQRSPPESPDGELCVFTSLRRSGYTACISCNEVLSCSAKFCSACGAAARSADDDEKTPSLMRFRHSASDGLLMEERESHTKSPLAISANSSVCHRRAYRRTVKLASKFGKGRLGSGASGTVYKAIDVHSGQQLAVKEISMNHEDEHTTASIRNELRHLSTLQHPNLVEYLGCLIQRPDAMEESMNSVSVFTKPSQGTRDKKLRVLILMERLECGTLGDLAAQFPSGLPLDTVVTYVTQLVDAVSYVHQCGITHRDIKPANILLASDGTIKLTDFGSASITLNGESADGGRITGTPAYMPPESIGSTVEVGGNWSVYGKARDIWAIGCVTHELLTGIVPWSHLSLTNPFALLIRIKKLIFPVSETLPPLAKDFCRKCLANDPMHRATAQELLSHPFLSGNRT